jgi:hypothetical protein
MRTAVIVEGKDIKNIGHAKYSENGKLNILCNGSTYGIEGILLRSILSCINPEYRIIGEGDFCYNNGDCDWEFKTNMPFAEYVLICREG